MEIQYEHIVHKDPTFYSGDITFENRCGDMEYKIVFKRDGNNTINDLASGKMLFSTFSRLVTINMYEQV